MKFTCPTCKKGVPKEVWHCPGCDNHNLIELAECETCSTPKPGIEEVEPSKELTQWNSIRNLITRITNTDISLLAKDDVARMGQTNYSLEAVRKWAKNSQQKLEIQNEIAEYRLRLNRKQGEWIESNIPEDGGGDYGNQYALTKNSQGSPTLSDVGIDRNDSPKFRAIARLRNDKFEGYISQCIEESREISTLQAAQLYTKIIATKWTGDEENYTPSLYIEAARSVMGSIDCDPASCDIAQQVVKAKIHFTKEHNGLIKTWEGNIFLNPPYCHPEVSQFVEKLLIAISNGNQAILLTNNNTDTQFFHKAAKLATALCFTKGRISFYKGDQETRTSPTNGQVFFYFGENKDRFIEVFSEIGLIMIAL